MSREPLSIRLSPSERALEMERMTKCLRFAGDVMTAVGDSFQVSEHKELIGTGEFAVTQFDPLLKKHDMLCSDKRKQKLLLHLGNSIEDYGGTTCGVWDYAHSVHHIVFDEDV